MTPPPNLSDLVEKAHNGDRSALDRLLEVYRERLESHIVFRLGAALRGKVEIDDVVQDTLLKAFESFRRFEWQGEGSLFRWLCGIAENRLLDLADRHRRKLQLRLDRDVRASGESPSVGVRREERFDRLEESLAKLSEDHRKVILLARIEGLPLAVVAERMNRTPNAAAQLLWRALQKLRLHFGDTESLHLPPRRVTGELRDDG